MLAEVPRVRTRPAPAGAGPPSPSPCTTTPGAMDVVFFNQPWRAKQLAEGTEAIFWGKVGDYRGTAPDGQPGGRRGGRGGRAGRGPQRRTLRILPIYPASAKAGLTSWEIGTFVEEALGAAGEFVDPLAERWRASLDLWDRTAAMRAVHGPESMRRDRRRPGAGWSSTSCSASSWPWSCAGGPSSTMPAPSPPGLAARDHRRRHGTLVAALPRRPALRAHDGPAAGPGGDRGRPGRPLPHAPAAPGRRRLGQDRGGPGRPARWRSRAGTRAP